MRQGTFLLGFYEGIETGRSLRCQYGIVLYKLDHSAKAKADMFMDGRAWDAY